MGDCDSSGPTGASPLCQCVVPYLSPNQVAKQHMIANKLIWVNN